MLKTGLFQDRYRFTIDCKILKKTFPKLNSIYCNDALNIVNTTDEICILNPFELGELSFLLARDRDIAMANSCLQELWALDSEWAEFFCKVAKDYCRKPEGHEKFEPDSTVRNWTGMDHLFHIYLLGWYHAGDDFCDESDKVYVSAHKDFNKAIDLLPIRFQNCSVDEIAYKLYWDWRYLKESVESDYLRFVQVLEEAEKICPGVLAKMRDSGWVIEDCDSFFPIRTCNMCGKIFEFWDYEENICLDHSIGYGSKYDLRRIQLSLCCHCFDKVIDWILPQCKHDPMSE